ncbi:L-aspartate oxidase [Williamsia sterculiae]|uniref:L-aspartate oxidase n=1 Tax=Williamsia sterculiae TaxID=1344003 RepID=A0A1N7FLE6_9NOCA|nr:L-aspartate oxidase [Williamsia sterculiae]SIS01228.1 L-aspartate oxidase [Williamsia sterculiae]
MAARTTGWSADLVVVGAGVGGLTTAVAAAELGLRVVVVSKAPRVPREPGTATHYAQGGIAVVGPGDSIDAHLADTVAAGAGLTDPVAARSILAEGPAAVAELIGWGARFDLDRRGRLSRTREGGHGVRRIVHAGGDATGAAVQRTLTEAVTRWTTVGSESSGSVRVMFSTTVTGVLRADDGAVVGVTVIDHAGAVATVAAPTTVLATGGSGHLFAATTNPAGATGDGVALALHAGAEVADLEFVQFHPTMLWTPAGRRGRRALVSEAVRGEGGRLVDAHGRAVTADVPGGDLAPRDVVARAVDTAMRRTGSDHVFLDVGAISGFEERFPTVSAGVRAAGLDLAGGRIPVQPGAHYQCGGVVVDEGCRTAVSGLLAVGEVARTGLHGANRLASNSLLEGLVTGLRAARTAADRAGGRTAVAAGDLMESAPRLDRRALQDAMSEAAGLRRTGVELDALAGALSEVESRPLRTPGDHEDAALLSTARVVVAAALARTASLGGHHRADGRGDPDLRSTAVRLRDGDPHIVPLRRPASGCVAARTVG